MNPVQELSGTSVTANLLTGPGVDEIFTRTDSAGARDFLTDSFGSMLALTDSSGTMQTQYTYEPFGKTTSTGQTNTNSFEYTGREHDGTGLYFDRARYYNPTLGRFISEDPLGFGGGDFNVYAYASGNPISYRDSYGLWFGIDDLVFSGGGAVVGVLGQGLGDLLSGHVSSWQNYAGASIGGAAGGKALLYIGPIGAGAIGGLTTNLAKQGLENLTGAENGFDPLSALIDTGIGAATGFISGPSISGITAGRGSFNSIYRQIATKASNGTISGISAATAGKMFAGRAFDTGLLPGAGAGAVAGFGANKLLGLFGGSQCGRN